MFRSIIPVLLVGLALALPVATQGEENVSLEQVQREIEERGLHWTAAPTSVSGVDWADFEATLLLKIPDNYDTIPKVDLSRIDGKAPDLPERWDWREHDGTTPVQNQGSCGSCWAFAAVGALEGCARITDYRIYDLSEQQLIACNRNGYGCDGGWFDGCFVVFHEWGAVSEDCMPYLAIDTVPCAISGCEILTRAAELIWLYDGMSSIKAAIYEYGPIACAMSVHADFRYYTGGCYEHASGGELNHAVVIVGWDDNACDGNGAWICKNSWGTHWGEDGWFNIRYEHSGIGNGSTVFVPVPGQVVSVDTVPVENTEDETIPFEIVAELHSHAHSPIDPDSALLNYRINDGEWIQMTMHPTRQEKIWSARIPSQPMPSSVDYYIRVTDIEKRPGTAPKEAPEEYFSFDVARVWEDFERSHPGWSVGDSDDDATSGLWECVAPVESIAQPGEDRTVLGTRCWVTGQHVVDEDSGFNDVDGGKTTLYSPGYELTGSKTAIVRYWKWFSNDRGGAPSSDAWVVQARNNGGAWFDLENTTESSNEWVEVEVDLIEFFGRPVGQVDIRFIATDEGRPSCVEAAVDDVIILADPREITVAQSVTASAVWLGDALPNPIAQSAMLPFALEEGQPLRLDIFSVSGRRVRSLFDGTVTSGRHQVFWDGRDDAGKRVASGTYYSKLTAAGVQVTRTLRVVR